MVSLLAGFPSNPQQADAAFNNPFPSDEFGVPLEWVRASDNLFVVGTSDVAGGRVCLVAPGSSATCDNPDWGTTNVVVGVGTVTSLIEAAPLRAGSWQIRSEQVQGDKWVYTGQSDTFRVLPCSAGCDTRIAAAQAARWKAAALQTMGGAVEVCTAFAAFKAFNAGKDLYEKGANRATIKGAGDAMNDYSTSGRGVVGTVVGAGAGAAIAMGFTLPDPFGNHQRGLQLLRDVSCTVSMMYQDIVNDPPDPNFGEVFAPTFATVDTFDDPGDSDLIVSLDRQAKYGIAALHGFERYQGAVDATNDAGICRQAQAIADNSYGQRSAMRDSAAELRRYAANTNGVTELQGPVVTQADKDDLIELYQRVRATGFTPEETAELEALGLDVDDIAMFRESFNIDIAALPVDQTLAQILSSWADDLTAQSVEIDLFGRNAEEVRNTICGPNQAPMASFDLSTSTGSAPFNVVFNSTSVDPDGDTITHSWDFGDGTTATGATVTHLFDTPGSYPVTLTVSDGSLTSATQSTIIVNAPAPLRAEYTVAQTYDAARAVNGARTLDTGVSEWPGYPTGNLLRDGNRGWATADGVTDEQEIIVELAGAGNDLVDQVVLTNVAGTHSVKTFSVALSDSPDPFGSYTTVLDHTSLAPSVTPQTFAFPGRVAGYLKLTVHENYGAPYMQLTDLFVPVTGRDGGIVSLAAGGATDAAVIDQSSEQASHPASATIQPDAATNYWLTPNGSTIDQFLTVKLRNDQAATIDRVSIASGAYRPRHVDVQVSTDGTTFESVATRELLDVSGTQLITFAPVQARFVKLVVDDGYMATFLRIDRFRVYSIDRGTGTAVPFANTSDGPATTAWAWNFGDGTTSTEQHPVHTFPGAGTYPITLTVTDADGATDTVNGSYTVPSVDATLELTTTGDDQADGSVQADEAEAITLTASSPDTAIDHWQWDLDYTQPATTAASVSATFPDDGSYTVRYRGLTSDWLWTPWQTTTFTIRNVAPTVRIATVTDVVDEDTTPQVLEVSDPAGDTMTCTWDWGDASPVTTVTDCTATSARIGHAYALSGTYTVTLTADDGDGGVTSASVAVTVTPRPVAMRFMDVTPVGDDLVVALRLRDARTAEALDGQTVQFSLDGGAPTSAITNVAGSAMTTITGGADATDLTATFAGTARIAPGSLTRPVVLPDDNTLVIESFTEATVDDPGAWVSGGDGPAEPGWPGGACLTAGTVTTQSPIPGCKLTSPDDSGRGALRLTPHSSFTSGFALYNKELPTSSGLDIRFEQAQYGSPGWSADGISLFLVDGSTNLTRPGGWGGGLGYSPHEYGGRPGVENALIGIGIDKWGNFSSPGQAGSGCLPGSGPGTAGPGPRSNRISVRGPGNGNIGYCWLGMSESLGNTLQGYTRADTTVTVRVVIDEAGVDTRMVTVYLDDEQVLQIPAPQELLDAETFKFGFAGSTGQASDHHEVWNLRIESIIPIPDPTTTTSSTTSTTTSSTSTTSTSTTSTSTTSTSTTSTSTTSTSTTSTTLPPTTTTTIAPTTTSTTTTSTPPVDTTTTVVPIETTSTLPAATTTSTTVAVGGTQDVPDPPDPVTSPQPSAVIGDQQAEALDQASDTRGAELPRTGPTIPIPLSTALGVLLAVLGGALVLRVRRSRPRS